MELDCFGPRRAGTSDREPRIAMIRNVDVCGGKVLCNQGLTDNRVVELHTFVGDDWHAEDHGREETKTKPSFH